MVNVVGYFLIYLSAFEKVIPYGGIADRRGVAAILGRLFTQIIRIVHLMSPSLSCVRNLASGLWSRPTIANLHRKRTAAIQAMRHVDKNQGNFHGIQFRETTRYVSRDDKRRFARRSRDELRKSEIRIPVGGRPEFKFGICAIVPARRWSRTRGSRFTRR